MPGFASALSSLVEIMPKAKGANVVKPHQEGGKASKEEEKPTSNGDKPSSEEEKPLSLRDAVRQDLYG